MTAFLKIDDCAVCHRSLPWDWVPAVLLNGRPLAGTAVWRSQLLAGQCPDCLAAQQLERQKQQQALILRTQLINVLGGEKAYREFTFERFQVAPGNRLAFERCSHFNPSTDNLYLWGPCGVGKTHLAYAGARHCFEETLSVAILLSYQLSRKLRMRDPEQEETAMGEFLGAEVLVLDDLGVGPDTAYTRQLLQEILDGRDFADRAGLVVTSKYSLSALAQKLDDDAIPSRLAGMCQVVEIKGTDYRLTIRGTGKQGNASERRAERGLGQDRSA
jgi:DNA replication protein DnaC